MLFLGCPSGASPHQQIQQSPYPRTEGKFDAAEAACTYNQDSLPRGSPDSLSRLTRYFKCLYAVSKSSYLVYVALWIVHHRHPAHKYSSCSPPVSPVIGVLLSSEFKVY